MKRESPSSMFLVGGMAAQTGYSHLFIVNTFLTLSYSLIATIKKERPDLLLHIENIDAKQAIPETPPPHFLEKQQAPEIEDIGIAPIANFFTMSSINPENWYRSKYLFKVSCNGITIGGYSRNTMECEDFGILSKRHSILGWGINLLLYRKKSSIPCPMIPLWTANYGIYLAFQKKSTKTNILCCLH